MNTLTRVNINARIQDVTVSEEELIVGLDDGRVVSVPTLWYPRLAYGNMQERQNWQLLGRGTGIHWPDLDEDVSLEAILLGEASSESQASLRKWLESRLEKVE
jgi:hypothetical protein